MMDFSTESSACPTLPCPEERLLRAIIYDSKKLEAASVPSGQDRIRKTLSLFQTALACVHSDGEV